MRDYNQSRPNPTCGSGVVRGGPFNLERGGKEEKKMKVPTTATLIETLLPGLPTGRSLVSHAMT